jgi:hypothetical protein
VFTDSTEDHHIGLYGVDQAISSARAAREGEAVVSAQHPTLRLPYSLWIGKDDRDVSDEHGDNQAMLSLLRQILRIAEQAGAKL